MSGGEHDHAAMAGAQALGGAILLGMVIMVAEALDGMGSPCDFLATPGAMRGFGLPEDHVSS